VRSPIIEVNGQLATGRWYKEEDVALLSGKAAIVTGAGSGIGKATAILFGEEGASVACLARTQAAIDETAAAIEARGGTALAIRCDVSDSQATASAVAQVVERFGRLDTLCNIAGTGKMKFDADETLEEWNRVIAVNLTGTFFMCRHALPHLLQSKGCIVNCSSTFATDATPWGSAYAASKGGVIAMTLTMAATYIKQGIRVNCVASGPVDTPMAFDFIPPPGADPQLVNFILPVEKIGQPEEIANVFAFLASDRASNVNGVILKVDGGLRA
jgi:NAD(P)-dependent dehydrogenase (short-subunit alcohol dehydrogenase family)